MIQDRILKLEKVDWRNIQPLQPDNIKHVFNYQYIEDSIRKNGFAFPFGVWECDGVIYAVDGHTRKEVLSNMEGVPDLLPAFFIDAKDRKEAVKILLDVFNQKQNPVDQEVLLQWLEVEEIEVEEVAVDSLNMREESEEEEIHLEAEEDDYEEPANMKVDVVLGDLITFEKGGVELHRVLCGDSTDSDAVARVMNGEKADMVFTDPPYNTGMTSKKQGDSTWLSHMFNDSYTDDEWQSFMSGFCSCYDLFTKNNSFLFICLDWRRSYELIPHIKQRWKLSNLIVWDKMVHGLGSDYKYTHEFIHVCKKGSPPSASNKNGEKEYQDVWRIQRKMGRDDDHATKKPLELCIRGINHTSSVGQIIADFFLGSHSTMVAAHQLNRKCYGLELDPKYCQVGIDRMHKLDPDLVIKINGKEYTPRVDE